MALPSIIQKILNLRSDVDALQNSQEGSNTTAVIGMAAEEIRMSTRVTRCELDDRPRIGGGTVSYGYADSKTSMAAVIGMAAEVVRMSNRMTKVEIDLIDGTAFDYLLQNGGKLLPEGNVLENGLKVVPVTLVPEGKEPPSDAALAFVITSDDKSS